MLQCRPRRLLLDPRPMLGRRPQKLSDTRIHSKKRVRVAESYGKLVAAKQAGGALAATAPPYYPARPPT